jgi:L-lactate utilization protein LutB
MALMCKRCGNCGNECSYSTDEAMDTVEAIGI